MLLQLEQECLNIYRKKVEKTRKYKADLHQTLAEADAEITDIVSALGEHATFSRVYYFLDTYRPRFSYCYSEDAFLFRFFICLTIEDLTVFYMFRFCLSETDKYSIIISCCI